MTTTNVEVHNVELVRKGFEAFAAGNMAVLGELFDQKAVWRSAPAGILKGEYHGRDAIFAMFGLLHQETAGTFASKPLAFASSGDQVFVQAVVSGTRGGRTLHGGEVLIFTLGEGRVREVQLYTANYPEQSAFWS